jgi:glycosyltransferase involved in cell wall biosynthesis
MRIALVHGNDGSDVRIGKICRSLSRLGFEIHFIGWDRRPNVPKQIDLGGAIPHVIKYETAHGKGNLAGQLRFYVHVIRVLAELRPRVACGVNEEAAFFLLPLKRLLYRYLVCDVFDSLGARAAGRAWHLRGLMRAMSAVGLWAADRLIATDENRRAMLGRFAGKAIVVENVPEDPGPELALQVPSGPIRIWAAGSIEAEKGFPELLKAIEGLDEVEIWSAGWPYDDFAVDVFMKHPRVKYHGIVTSREALRLAASCDAVFSYYAPIHAYRTNASPNKVYDAMAVGRPVLINSEVRLARWVEEASLGIVCPYRDVECLRSAISGLQRRRASLQQFASYARQLFTEKYHWGLMETRLAELYGSLGRAR